MKSKYIYRKWKTEYSILLILICFFGGLCCIFGVQEFPDTNTYIHMHSDREPLYPLILWAFRTLFGKEYLVLIVMVQNGFAVFTSYLLIAYICRLFQTTWFGVVCIIAVALMPHIVTPFSSASNMVLTNSILSEGITFSLYYLFVYYLMKMIWDEEKSTVNGFAALLIAFLNSLARGQMMCMILAWACVAGFCVIRKKKWGALFFVLMSVAIIFGMRSLAVKSYNYMVNGSFVGNSGGGTTFLTNVLYSALEEDGREIEEGEQKQLFDDIFLRAQDDKLNYKFAEAGVINQALYHENTHDVLKFDYVENYLTWYVSDRMEGVGAIREVAIDQEGMNMAKEVIVMSFPRWLYVYFCVAVSGFIRTVAVIHPVLNVYTVVVYGMAIFGMMFQFYRNRHSKAGGFMMLAMLLICANVFATSMTIMCLSRYMIYNLPFFYIGCFLLIREMIQCKGRNVRKDGI